MPTKQQKEQSLNELRKLFKDAKVAIMTDFRGLNVAATTKLRRKISAGGGQFKVAKNTLSAIAAREAGIEGLDGYLGGPVGIVFGLTDPVAPAKALLEFAREFKTFEIKGGVIEGQVVDAPAIRELADLPPREVLLGRVLGGMQGPMYGLVNVLQGTVRSLVYVLDAVRAAKEGGGAPA
ncbi:MAG TPA: 50S ribosomal protein L10 [Spirochaetia bacterium]|nr:50S ribosomal protein L10 [Spirochaetia bacterium]